MADNDRKNIAYLTDIDGMAVAASGVTSGNIVQFGTESDGKRALVDSTKKVSDFYTKGEVDTKVSSATSGFWDALCGEYSVAAYLSDPWDTGQVYDVGAYCLHGGAGYRCITAHDSQAPFDPEKWELVLTAEGKSILDDLMSRYSVSGSVSPLDIASAFSSAKTYKVNDLVVQGGLLKICTTAGYGVLAEFSSGAVVEKALTAIIGALSGKQDEIADLDGIRAGAAMGADAHDRDRVVVDLSPGEPGDPPTVTAYSHNDTDGEHPVPLALKTDVSPKADRTELASEFSPDKSYEPGNLVVYGGRLYRCVALHDGAWDSSDFVESTVEEAISRTQSGGSDLTIIEPSPDRTGTVLLRNHSAAYVNADQLAYSDWSGDGSLPLASAITWDPESSHWKAYDLFDPNSHYDSIDLRLIGTLTAEVEFLSYDSEMGGVWSLSLKRPWDDETEPFSVYGTGNVAQFVDPRYGDSWEIVGVPISAESEPGQTFSAVMHFDDSNYYYAHRFAQGFAVSKIRLPTQTSPDVSREIMLNVSAQGNLGVSLLDSNGENISYPALSAGDNLYRILDFPSGPVAVKMTPDTSLEISGAPADAAAVRAMADTREKRITDGIHEIRSDGTIWAIVESTDPSTWEYSTSPDGFENELESNGLTIEWNDGSDPTLESLGVGWYVINGPIYLGNDKSASKYTYEGSVSVPGDSVNVSVTATRKLTQVGSLASDADLKWNIVSTAIDDNDRALLQDRSVNVATSGVRWVWSSSDASASLWVDDLNSKGAIPYNNNGTFTIFVNGEEYGNSAIIAETDAQSAYENGVMQFRVGQASYLVTATRHASIRSLAFPAATPGKSRSFILSLSVAQGIQPPSLPDNVTYLPASRPELKDGAVVRFTEVSANTFMVEEPLETKFDQADWNQTNPSAPDFIKNKPRLPEYSVDLDGVVSSEWTFSSDEQAALDGASPSLTFHDAVAPDSPYWSLTGLAEGWTAGIYYGGADATSLTFSTPGPDLALAEVYATRSASWLQKKLTFDDSPTPDSDHPVKSGGIQTALDGKLDSSAVYPEFDVGGTEYSTGDIVSFNGRLYRSRQDGNVHHEPSASSEYWESIILRDVNPSCIEDAAGNRINADRSVYHEISEHWEFSWNPSKPANVDLGVPWFSFDQTWQADLLVDGLLVGDFTFLAADNQGASSSSLAGTYTSSQVSYNVTATKVAGTEDLAGTLALEQGTKVEIGTGADAGTAVGASTGVVQSVAIGYNAMATGNTSTAVGKMADASSAQAIAVGQEAKGPQTGVALGLRANATAQNTEIVTPTGTDSLDSWDGSGYNGVAIGSDTAVNADSVAVGKKAQARGGTSVSIGSDAEAGFAAPSAGIAASNGSIAIGAAAKAKHTGAISIGSKSRTTGNDGIAIGSLSSAIDGTIAIGKGTAVRGSAGVAIGGGSSVEDRGSIAIGGFNSDGKKAIASGQRCVQIGKGTNNTPDSLQFHSANLFEAKTADGSQTHTDTVATLGAGFPSASTEVRGAVKLSDGALDNSGIARGVGDRAVYAKADGWELVEGQGVSVLVSPRWFGTEQEFLQDAYLEAQEEHWSGAGWYARLQVAGSPVIAWLGDDPDVYEISDTSGTIRFRREILWGASGYVLRASDDLVGQTFDFSSMAGVYGALKALVELFGGTVTNYPQQGGS